MHSKVQPQACVSTSAARSNARNARKLARKVQPHDPVGRLVAEVIDAVLARARDEAAAASDDLPVMRKLRAIEWFAGSGRLSFALKQQQGWDPVIHDRDVNAVEWAQHGEKPEQCTFRSDEFEEIERGSFYLEPPYD